MPADVHSKTRNYLERRLFDHFLRTGVHVDIDAVALAWERKFNSYHDPDDGRFTFKPGGGQLAPRRSGDPVRSTSASGQVRSPAPKPKPAAVGSTAAAPGTARQAVSSGKLGSLSSHFETGGRGSETVSSGMGRVGVPDRGGVSYGSYQLTSQATRFDKNEKIVIVKNGGNVADFLRSEGSRWSGEFNNLQPGTPSFSNVWRRIGRRDGTALQAAEHAWVKRNNYDPAVSRIKIATGLDIDRSPLALKDVLWSTAVQHGPGRAGKRAIGATKIVVEAIKMTDAKISRSSIEYNKLLILNIYLTRGAYWSRDRVRYKSEMDIALRRLKVS